MLLSIFLAFSGMEYSYSVRKQVSWRHSFGKGDLKVISETCLHLVEVFLNHGVYGMSAKSLRNEGTSETSGDKEYVCRLPA